MVTCVYFMQPQTDSSRVPQRIWTAARELVWTFWLWLDLLCDDENKRASFSGWVRCRIEHQNTRGALVQVSFISGQLALVLLGGGSGLGAIYATRFPHVLRQNSLAKKQHKYIFEWAADFINDVLLVCFSCVCVSWSRRQTRPCPLPTPSSWASGLCGPAWPPL